MRWCGAVKVMPTDADHTIQGGPRTVQRRLTCHLVLMARRAGICDKPFPHSVVGRRVAFPMQLRLSHVVGSEAGADALYDLTGVVVHVGSGPYHGHYVALAKSHGQWLNFDDEGVEPVPESAVLATFGSSTEMMATMDHCFLLMYIRKPEDWGC